MIAVPILASESSCLAGFYSELITDAQDTPIEVRADERDSPLDPTPTLT
jgi:hypothetical protein